MEAFSLLKYWRSSGGVPGGSATTTTTTTVVSTAAVAGDEAEESPYSSDCEDGPFFDLEFAVPDGQESDADEEPPAESPENDKNSGETEKDNDTESESGESDSSEEDEGGELKFALASDESTDQSAAALSPSDELFFKGDLVSIEPSSILLNGSSEEHSKFPVFLVKSATKFRVLMLKLKKSKSVNGENSLDKPEKDENSNQCKFMAVKFKVDGGPLVSLFSRDNSSKENAHGGKGLKSINSEDSELTDEKRLTKEVVHKYLKMVKPLYVRVSKLKFPGHLSFHGGGAAAPPSPSAAEGVSATATAAARGNAKAHNLQAGLKVVRKHLVLVKSRSASAAVAAAPSPKPASNRRDDSLLQVQDGIQGAIMHCKRSFNASRDEESSSSILCRSVSDPSKTVVSSNAASTSSSTSSFCGEAKETTV